MSGAAGTSADKGERGPKVRAGLAAALGLSSPGHSWHVERDSTAAFAARMAKHNAKLGKMGADLILQARPSFAEVSIVGARASSTMLQVCTSNRRGPLPRRQCFCSNRATLCNFPP